MSAKPTAGEFIVVSQWLQKNKQMILDTRPNQKDLMTEIRRVTGINIGIHSMMQICKELDINWVTKKTYARAGTKVSLRILCDSVVKLYKEVGVNVPEELSVLKNVLEEK